MAGGLAIALSGGGAKGAFQVGVLDELVTNRGVDFETAVGTSTGAIQAAGVAQNDIPGLLGFWTGLSGPGDIFRSRGGTGWALITGKNSLYSTGPLQKLLKQAFDDERIRATGKKLRLATVNITNGKLQIVGENAPDIWSWVYASSAQPPFFPPWVTKNADGLKEQWVDGGVRDITPLDAALKERPRAVLAVRAEAPLQSEPRHYDSLIDIGLRSVELLTREVGDNDLKNVNLMNRLLTAETHQRRELERTGLDRDVIDRIMRPFHDEIARFRLVPTMVLEPESDLYDTLEFVPSLIEENIERGRQCVRDKWPELSRFLGVEE